MTSLSITDKNFVNQIYERNRFPYQICVSHPITYVQQLLLLFDLERSNDFYKCALD